MEFALLGWSSAGPTLGLDHREFAYAGKFVVGTTGKAVVREDGPVVAAASFSPDRTDPATLVVRYVTVRCDRQGEGVAPRLLRFVSARARERDFEAVRIAVNNPFAYVAAYRAGFAYTGEETGMAELVLVDGRGAELPDGHYRRGLETFANRDLPPGAASFVADKRDQAPPSAVSDPA